MIDKFFYPYEQAKLWSKDFILLSVTGFFLYVAVYFFLAVNTLWFVSEADFSYEFSALCMSLFAFGMFLPGIFNSYLIDAFKRKSVCQCSLLLFIVTTYLFLYVDCVSFIIILRLLQGALFSLIVMSTGSTLVIDVTPSRRRTDANIAYAWWLRFGMLAGLILGYFLFGMLDYTYLIYITILMGAVALLATVPLSVNFHAPLEPPICSLDRFLLPSTLLLAGNLLFIGFIMGTLIGHIADYSFYLFFAIGILIALMLMRYKMDDIAVRISIEIGFALLLLGLVILFLSLGLPGFFMGAIVTGMGMGICLSRFLVLFIAKARHCERGTANNTYFLTVELAILIGFLFENSWTKSMSDSIYYVGMLACVIGIVLFETMTHKYYKA